MIEFENDVKGPTKIKVIGVGGAGGNTVNRLLETGVKDVEFIATNTDLQVLNLSLAPVKIPIGAKITEGKGAGGDPEKGEQAAMEDRDSLASALEGADMVFITAGMGGGTGTGAAPVIAEITKEMGILTVAVVTKPFPAEGSKRQKIAEEGLAKLVERVDALIVIPNEKLLSVLDKKTLYKEAFRKADDVLRQGIQGITEMLTKPGIINVDFADVKAIMSIGGNALMGIGVAEGEDRGVQAAQQAITSPLTEEGGINGAKGVIFSVAGAEEELGLHEVNEAATMIKEVVAEEADIIWGSFYDNSLEGKLKITVIATGFGKEEKVQKPTPKVIDYEAYRRSPLRRREISRVQQHEKEQEVHKFYNTDIFEIPTFLRKQAD